MNNSPEASNATLPQEFSAFGRLAFKTLDIHGLKFTGPICL